MDIVDIINDSPKKEKLLLAAAGSGKTRVLIEFVSKMIQSRKIDPFSENVIIFTFTKKASDELMVRLSHLFQDNRTMLDKLYIGTIHGWCKNYLDKENTLSNTKILDELERLQLILRLYNYLKIKEYYKEKNAYENIIFFINDLEIFYNENLDLNDKNIPNELKVIFIKYLDFLKSQRLMDFGYLIRESIKTLSKAQRENLPFHIFVDEYQDVNPAQVKLIQSMLRRNQNSTLFAVGDPRQTIYQWRGSDISKILNFAKDFEDSEIFRMNKNHRSRTGIIKFANLVARDLDFSKSIKIEDMIPSTRKDENTSVFHYYGDDDHEKKIIELIQSLNSEGVSNSDIAILTKSVTYYCPGLMDALDSNGISYYSPNRNSGFNFITEFIESLIGILEIYSITDPPRNPYEEEELAEKFNKYLENIKKYCNQKTEPEQIINALRTWHEILMHTEKNKSEDIYYKNESYNFRKAFFEFCSEVGFVLTNENIDLIEGFSAVTQIMRSMEEVYRRRFSKTYNLRPAPIVVLTKNLRNSIRYELERWTKVSKNDIEEDRITISTIHAAKGIEWPVVIAPFMWKRSFPSNKDNHKTSFPEEYSRRYGTDYEDQKRMWYVTATRARDRLYYISTNTKGRLRSEFTYSDYIKNEQPYIIESENIQKNINYSLVEKHSRDKYFYLDVSRFLILVECPYEFYLRYIKGIEVPVGEEFGAGDLLHKVIERSSQGKNSYEEIIEEEVYLPLAEYSSEIRHKKIIEKKIKKLIDSKILENIDRTEYKFNLNINQILIKGIVDATKINENGIEIIDWKSSIKDKFIQRYENQLRIYAWGLRNLGHKINKATIYDLSQEDVENSKIDVDITNDEIDKIIKRANENISALLNQKIVPTPNFVSCEICDVNLICPYRKTNW